MLPEEKYFMYRKELTSSRLSLMSIRNKQKKTRDVTGLFPNQAPHIPTHARTHTHTHPVGP